MAGTDISEEVLKLARIMSKLEPLSFDNPDRRKLQSEFLSGVGILKNNWPTFGQQADLQLILKRYAGNTAAELSFIVEKLETFDSIGSSEQTALRKKFLSLLVEIEEKIPISKQHKTAILRKPQRGFDAYITRLSSGTAGIKPKGIKPRGRRHGPVR